MNKLRERVLLLLLLTVIGFSLVVFIPVSADISGVQLYNETYDVTDHGRYDETIIVMGTGVTAGEDVKVGWDGLKAWDGEKGILNTTEADGDGSFEIWFEVPEATNGTHYIWLKDMETGDTWGGITEPTSDINVHTYMKFSPSSGLKDDKITIKGYGFDDEEEICDVIFGFDLGYASWVNLTTTTLGPAHPETTELGSWEATFKVPDLTHTEYQVRVRQRGTAPRLAAWKKFTIGPSITLDIEEGPMGTIVEISGRGFTNGRVIDTGSVWLNDTGWSNKCFVTDDDTVDNGKFKVDFVIPWVSDEDEYEVWVTDGAGRDADADFEVTGLAEIEVEPEYGSQGSTIKIEGYNFTQISGEEVRLELWGDPDAVPLVDYIANIEIYETDSKGTFDGTFTVPARDSGVYRLVARQEGHGDTDDYNLNGTASFRIGLMIVIPTPNSGPSGKLVTLTGTGFTEGEDWNATLGDVTIVDDGAVDADSNLELDGDVPTFYVPTMDPGTYTLKVLDIDSEIEVETDFTVTATTMIETDPLVAPNDYNVTIKGKYFSADDDSDEDIDLDWVLFNVTEDGELDEDWDMDVYQGDETAPDPAIVDDDGNFTAWWEVPDDDTLSLGDYWINATDDEGEMFAQFMFTVVSEEVEISPRKASFAVGETVAFDIESSFSQHNSYIEIYDPDGELYWQTDAFADVGDDDVWVKVGVIERVPYYEQTAGGNPMTLEDVPLGTWSWTWYDSGKNEKPYDKDDDELDSGTFTVTEAAEDVLAGQISELGGNLDALTEDFTGLTEDVEALSGAVAGLADSVSTAISAANAAKAAADDAADALTDIAETANSAKTAADSAKTAADAAKDSADRAGEAASGLTTLVYGAIGASLIAALAAIVSLMQISRRIAG